MQGVFRVPGVPGGARGYQGVPGGGVLEKYIKDKRQTVCYLQPWLIIKCGLTA